MKIAVLYNIVEELTKCRDNEKVSYNEVADTANEVMRVLKVSGHSVKLVKVSEDLKKTEDELKDCEFVFNLAEGIAANSGAERLIAEMLERSGLAFTGAGSYSLGACQDKKLAKEIFEKHNVPTPKSQLFCETGESIRKAEHLTFPLIIKPVKEDGSLGISSDSVVNSEEELKKKATEIIKVYKQPVLVEEFIAGREFNSSMVEFKNKTSGKNEMAYLPISEIIFDYPKGMPKILTFESKWDSKNIYYKSSTSVCPAVLSVYVEEKIKKLSKICFEAMRCRDYARVDFRMDNNNNIYVIEVNPNPCIHPFDSGFARSAKAYGWGYGKLVLNILESAKRRNKQRNTWK